MDIVYTPKFVKTYRKLPLRIKLLCEKKEKIFANDPHDSRLKTHSLGGELTGRWSFWVNYEYRVVFRFEDKSSVIFLVVGTHEIYK